MSAVARPTVTAEEYLALEAVAETKSEFVGGEVYAMAGGSLNHSRIQVNLIAELAPALGARRCQSFSSDARVQIEAHGDYVYPDFSAVCGEVRSEGQNLLNPTIVVEVMSPTSERYDRGLKFALYQSLPSLEEYVLVSQDGPRVERYRRQGDVWIYEAANGLEGTINVLGTDVPLGAIYLNVDFSAEA